ncbi:hypothetical protein J4Q44_G00113690 [Coregonus suidteri]|uniref:Uncharacterized protein n=1 Tax=Coregonus suidteri TaxID=861788 RepID=A0AAN8R0L0_9TELE
MVSLSAVWMEDEAFAHSLKNLFRQQQKSCSSRLEWCKARNLKTIKELYEQFIKNMEEMEKSHETFLQGAQQQQEMATVRKPYWRCYYSNTDAVIYVVDSSDQDRMGISKSELVAMLENKDQLNRNRALTMCGPPYTS